MGLKGDRQVPQGVLSSKGRRQNNREDLGSLLKTLLRLGIGGFALKYIGPAILPKLLLLAKTKLIPIIGTALKGSSTKLED